MPVERNVWSALRDPRVLALGLVIFGKTFSQLHAIPSGGVPYLDFLAPGVLAQSTLFVAVFYGIQVIW